MAKEFLLEIGTEEIPAGYIAPAVEQLKTVFAGAMAQLNLPCGDIQVFATPRRMVMYVKDLAEKQKNFEEEVTGPPKKVAVDENGNYTKAAAGFAASQGIAPDKLKIITKDNKEYVGFVKKGKGEKTADILQKILPDMVLSLNFPKGMRWGEGDIRFVRPIQWILALFGGKTIKFNIGKITSGAKTWGHRFMANKAFAVKNFEHYKSMLNEKFVILDAAQRKEIIVSSARNIAAEVGGVIDEDAELFDTLSYLVEYPVPMRGSFEDKFLSLPKEILIITMKNHQKYIPILDKNGKLLPYFVIVSNTKVENPQTVINGNSKVVRARFADAEYYFEKDKKIRLDERTEQLKKVVFQIKLGSYHEKTVRLLQLSDFIASMIAPDVKEKAKRAAYLCKADLVTGMVYEFPALQGIIGAELARLQGEDEQVYKAVYEHYLPQSPDDPIASTAAGIVLSLADKADNLTGFFGIGLAPKGASDPYGMRRQAISIIRIILEKNIDIDYTQLIRFAYENLKDKLTLSYENVLAGVTEFIESRFYYQMEIQGYSAEIIGSILAVHPVNLSAAKKIIGIMEKESKSDSFKSCIFAFKRIANITKGVQNTGFEPALFKEEQETKLFEAYKLAESGLKRVLEDKRFEEIPQIFSALKPAVDEYFEKVLVMDKDDDVKNNRLAFLAALKALFDKVMDFTKIQL